MMNHDVPFAMVTIDTYAYEGEHGYFRSWFDRHGWGDPSLARAVRLHPYLASGTPRTAIVVVGDRGQKSHREVKREVCFAEASFMTPRYHAPY